MNPDPDDLQLDTPDPADLLRINAVQGWLGLGDVQSAALELEELPQAFQAHPLALKTRARVLMASKDWDGLVDVSRNLLLQNPNQQQAWVDRSYALHEMKRTQEAFEALRPAMEFFPTSWVIPYNLACYCAQTGRLSEARNWLQHAALLSGKQEIKCQALEDSDLQPLWEELSRL